ncbi:MAG: hypothetical protein ABGY95_06630 [Rubritalea sp.]|uniref:hypothetical protein n=1 Tax=Rubritalea sp. TaxID=2109375 RepID=UPI003242B89B
MLQRTTQKDPIEPDVTNEKEANNSFPISIAIDPVRILGGILTRWYWLLLGGVALGVVGFLVGMKLNKQAFSLSTALIRGKIPQVQTSEIGQPFQPADLNDATLLSILLATEPLEYAMKRVNNGLSGLEIAEKVKAAQLENTDIYYITYRSSVSDKDALKFVTIWSEEIIEYTKRLQQSEARAVRDILAKEVRQLEFRIDQLDLRIIDFAKKNNFFGGESQVTALLDKISQIELQLGAAKSQKASLLAQIEELYEKIQHHSPLGSSLREATQELANLRSTYTDQNPLVKSRLASILHLETEVARLSDVKNTPLEKFTGSDLGNTIYLSIISSNSQLTDAENRIIALEEQVKVEQKKLSKYPSIIAKYNALVAKRGSQLNELSLLGKRLKETEIFASGSPGYFQTFEEPDIRKVVPSSMMKKPLILGGGGMIMGAGLALLITLFKTQRSSRRSVLECCATTGGRFVTGFPSEGIDAPEYNDFWLERLAMKSNADSPVLFWTAALTPEEEQIFWRGLSKAAHFDAGRTLKVYDLTPEVTLADEQEKQQDLLWGSKDSECYIWRAHSLPDRSKRGLLSSVEECYALIATEKSSLQAFNDSRELFEIYLPPCHGTLATQTPASGWFRIKADQLSLFLSRLLSR